MGLASGTITAVVLGLAGLVVLVLAVVVSRTKRKPE
jgi:LPXTG-motif cell wall-anchored protein